MADTTKTQGAYPPEFLADVDKFIDFANDMAAKRGRGQVSAAILFAAGRYNSFNFLSNGGADKDQSEAIAFYTQEYSKAFESNLDGAIGPVVGRTG